MIATTTLNSLQVDQTWLSQLLRSLDKSEPDDKPLTVAEILKHTCLEDAIHCLRFSDASQKDISFFGVWCAKQVQHLMKDDRSITALGVAEGFLCGNATSEELEAANSSARLAKVDHIGKGTLVTSPIDSAFWATIPAKDINQASEYASYAAQDALDAAWAMGLATFDHTKLDSALDCARKAINSAKDAQELKFKEMFCE